MDDYPKILENILRSHKRSASFFYKRQTLWFKRGLSEPVRVPFRRTRNTLAKWQKNPLYFSTEASQPGDFEGEVKRLIKLENAGVHVPKVIDRGENWVVMNDLGPTVRSIIGAGTPEELERSRGPLQEAAAALGKLHQAGLWHGRPALRDITWDGERTGFIDFEEDPAAFMSPLFCQVRDILSFLHNLATYCPADSGIFEECIKSYRRHGPSQVWEQAQKTADSMWFISGLLKVTHPFIGKDGRAARSTLKNLTRRVTKIRRKFYLGLLIFSQAWLLMRLID